MEVCKAITKALSRGEGALIGRFGTIELEVLCWAESQSRRGWPEQMLEVIEKNAGIFPNSADSIAQWAEATKIAVSAADVLAVGWYAKGAEAERALLEKWSWRGSECVLRSLEPYYWPVEQRWTRLLAGKDVCVVSSFAETAKKQFAKGEAAIWGAEANGSIWPASMKAHWVQTGYAPVLAQGRAGWEESPESWEEAVDWVVGEVLKTGARIVVIGCGGMGMIIGGRLKAAGKICVVMGGAVQVLFGIKGVRWETHKEISQLWKESWVWPALEETPRGAEGVEGGCYWSSAGVSEATG